MNKQTLRRKLLLDDHVCPWWLAFTFDNPLRRFIHNPAKIFNGWLSNGQTAIDLGCGLGYFSIAMAQRVGQSGRVIAVDLQAKMLQTVEQRAVRAGLQDRIQRQRCQPTTLGLQTQADFILAFWMVHEVPDTRRFLEEVRGLLKPAGRFLFVEPIIHVPAATFQHTLDLAGQVGLQLSAQPAVNFSRAALLTP
jgi:ubiquinone/menaquinone biosynthesis C-methylase UbiE